MASFTTGIELFSSNGNSITYVVSASHTATEPRLVIQKRVLAEGNKKAYEMSTSVIHGLVDADSAPLPTKLSFSANVRVPLEATSTEVDAALATFRDFVASDEFADSVSKQLWLQ